MQPLLLRWPVVLVDHLYIISHVPTQLFLMSPVMAFHARKRRNVWSFKMAVFCGLYNTKRKLLQYLGNQTFVTWSNLVWFVCPLKGSLRKNTANTYCSHHSGGCIMECQREHYALLYIFLQQYLLLSRFLIRPILQKENAHPCSLCCWLVTSKQSVYFIPCSNTYTKCSRLLLA